MHPDSLLSELGALSGVNHLRLNDQGCAALVFDQSITVNFEWNESAGQFLIYTVLGKVPADAEAGFFRLLLEANAFGLETGGATLSVDALENEILLHRSIPLEATTPASFQTLVEDFVETVEAWQIKLSQPGSTTTSAADSGSAPVSSPELLRI